MEETIKIVTLDNNLDYSILDEISLNSDTYVYLANIEDETDFCIRKVKIEAGEKFLVGLDNDQEFDKALNLYYTVHKNEN
ncbi:MAG: hypothetical protein IJ093_00145 [Bacilli bacterium]|nr:hypothetical protein [Bacilli bacterium]